MLFTVNKRVIPIPILSEVTINTFLRRASCKARLLVITLVSDSVVHLVLFCLHKPFSYLHSFHIYSKDKSGCFILDFFGSDLSKMDQTWLNLIKLDFLTNLKMLLWKVVTFSERIKMAVLYLIFLDKICPKWIKLD